MVWCGSPGIVQQFDGAEFLQHNATPVLCRSVRYQTGFTLPAVLVAEHTELSAAIPSQSMRAKQPRKRLVALPDGTLPGDRGPHQTIDVLHRLDFRLDDAHAHPHHTATADNFCKTQ